MIRQKPVTNGIYHIFNRGVDKRIIFKDDIDYLRFVHDLFEFNDTNPALNLTYYITKNKNQSKEVGLPNIQREPRKLLVNILSFCLMPNHFHLVLQQKAESGITEFMRKIGTGYTNYFNKKYERSGSLFQGKYKSVAIKNESHLLHIPFYIHLNPLDLIMPSWREKEIKDHKKVIQFLEQYRWSSFLDYTGKINFPSVTQREFLLKLFSGPQQYKKETLQFLKDMDIEEMQDFILE